MAEVVAIVVHHQVGQVVVNFFEHEVHEGWVGKVEFLLEELTSGLVDGQLNGVALECVHLLLLSSGFLVLAHDVVEHALILVDDDILGGQGEMILHVVHSGAALHLLLPSFLISAVLEVPKARVARGASTVLLL